MANDRLWVICRVCGEGLQVARSMGGDDVTTALDPTRDDLGAFIGLHSLVCGHETGGLADVFDLRNDSHIPDKRFTPGRPRSGYAQRRGEAVRKALDAFEVDEAGRARRMDSLAEALNGGARQKPLDDKDIYPPEAANG